MQCRAKLEGNPRCPAPAAVLVALSLTPSPPTTILPFLVLTEPRFDTACLRCCARGPDPFERAPHPPNSAQGGPGLRLVGREPAAYTMFRTRHGLRGPLGPGSGKGWAGAARSATQLRARRQLQKAVVSSARRASVSIRTNPLFLNSNSSWAFLANPGRLEVTTCLAPVKPTMTSPVRTGLLSSSWSCHVKRMPQRI